MCWRRRMIKRLLIILAIAQLVPFNIVALASDFSFSGFASQSIVVSNDNPFFSKDTGTNFNLREIGLHGGWQVKDDFRLAGQILSRKAGELNDGAPAVDFLLADKSLYTSNNIDFGARLGRVKSQFGLYNEVRDVPHARPGVFVPQAVYFESFRDSLIATDGGSLYLSINNKLGDIDAALSIGEAKINNNLIEYQLFNDDIQGEFNKADSLSWRLKFTPSFSPNSSIGISNIDARNLSFEDGVQITPALVNQIIQGKATPPVDKIDSYVKVLSLQHALKKWIYTIEYMHVGNEISFDQSLAPIFKSDTESYYAQAEWLFNEKLTFYGRAEALYYDKSDKYGKKSAARLGDNPLTKFNEALTVGARYYFTPDFALTGEFSKNKGAAFINGHGDINYDDLQEDWDTLIFQLSYHF